MKLLRVCVYVLGLCLCMMWSGLQAQTLTEGAQERQMMRQLQQAQDEVRLLQYRLEGESTGLRREHSHEQEQMLLDTQELSSRVVRQLERRSRLLQARLQELGEDSGDESEQATIHRERSQLRRADAALRADLRVAKLVQLETQQTRQLLKDAVARTEQEKRWQRSPSLLMLESLPMLRQAWPEDKQHLANFFQQWQKTWQDTRWQDSTASLWMVAAVLILVVALLRVVPLWIIRYLPAGRLRRSSLTIANFLLWLAGSWVVADQLAELFLDRPDISKMQIELLLMCKIAALVCAVVLACMKAIVMQPRASWRLIPLSDDAERRLRFFPYVFFLIAYIDISVDFFRGSIATSSAFQAFVDSLVSLLYLGLYGYGLWVLRGDLFSSASGAGLGAGKASRGWARLAFKGAVAIFALVAVLFIGGWQGLSDELMSHFITMPLLFGLIAYIFMVWLQDISDSLLAYLRSRSRDPQAAPVRAQSQLIVVFFALARMAVLLLTIWVINQDWLTEPKQMLESGLDVSRDMLRLGAVQWRLDLWFIALGVLLVGAVLIHVLRVWLRQHYMPNTTMEPGLQNAVVGMVSYIAYFVLLVVCLSMLGVPIESVTWIFTALTVGIGFGLRGIVQNIASGLMLMLERPIKVGDWVEVNGSDGNVRQIRLRATYVERFDRTMVMVPNAQMMGQQVRNLTYTPTSLGAVEARLLFPLDVDADLIMSLLQEAVQSQPEVLEDPAPVIFCDGIFGDGLAFGIRAFLGNMRLQRRVRSNVMLAILRRLRSHDITLHPAQRWVHEEMDKDQANEPDR